MKTISIVNPEGMRQIAGFLFENHNKGLLICETPSMLQAWANDAEFQLENSGEGSIEVLARDSVTGHTQSFVVGRSGFSTSPVDCE